jgi:hypothetical protein
MSEESRMTARGMGQNFIDNINTLFKNWKPIERFSIEKVSDKFTTYNPNAIQFTSDFDQKVKKVLS